MPAISKKGARSLLQRLSEVAGLEIDGEYLKPWGKAWIWERGLRRRSGVSSGTSSARLDTNHA